ncbi:MAG: apolipoprotein N-acyltransferase, partial [Gammaproteobacteria bacterium]|nr:apolipoprotein N-acyltransferase [Gammaproteobacteria bacterium]
MPSSYFLHKWRNGPVGHIAAISVGAITVLGFAPFAFFPATIICLAVFFWLTDGLSPRRALWRGWLFGLGMFLSGIHWIHISLYEFGKMPLPLALLIMAALVVLMALFPALAASLVARLESTPGWRRYLLVFPAAWTIIEWTRSWFMSGFPWLSLGYSQIDSWLAAYAPVGGVFAVSWVVAVSSGGLLMILQRGWQRWLGPAALAMIWGAAW